MTGSQFCSQFSFVKCEKCGFTLFRTRDFTLFCGVIDLPIHLCTTELICLIICLPINDWFVFMD